jgi:NAD(P)-dependent dehydrogenase (short-subunit alcohol dehydrogenase family)
LIREQGVEQFKSQVAAPEPTGRMSASEEIAKVALFLASDDSTCITKVELFVDGGLAQV